MAYTIIRSDGTVLTTIQDGTINTGSTTLGLPGRNYAGYGQTLDTNMVRMLENFASANVPANPLRGQLWYNTSDGTLRICPTDGTLVASSWSILNTASSGGNTTLGNIVISGNITSVNNISVTNSLSGATLTVANATVSSTLTAVDAAITNAGLTLVTTQSITTGGTSTSGAMTGRWSINATGNALTTTGNIAFASSTYGVKSDNYMYANGSPFTPSGTYTNANVYDYLTGSNAITQFSGNITPGKVTTSYLAGGGTIQGIWTLAANSRIQANYADLAERYEADAVYSPGTVLEIGGEKEVTAVKNDLSEEVFGVVSTNSAYLMNSGAGEDNTHPQVAIAGRLPVLVTGKIYKGQRLVAAGNGRARGASKEELTQFNSIGRSLQHKNDDGDGVIEAVVIIK